MLHAWIVDWCSMVKPHNTAMKATMVLVAVHAGVSLGLAGVFSAQQPAATRITVYEEIRAGRATYHYTVTSGSDRPIAAVMIGVDAMTGDFVLTALPAGWTHRDVSHANVWAPAGWTATVISAEESDKVAIQWSADPRAAIAPGQTVRGFRVALLRPTASYKSSDWQTTDNLGGATTGKLEQMRSDR
jgi:hypothetical protein